ncbi:MAG: methyl-accepting chemotaxis protein [Thiotrichaceae bacterium]
MSTHLSPSLSVNRKPVWVSLLLLLVSVALMIACFSYSYQQSLADKNRITLAADLTLLSQQLMTTTLSTIKGTTGSFDQIESQKNEFQKKFDVLEEDEKGHSFGLNRDNLDDVRITWASFSELLAQILQYKDAVTKTHSYAETVYETLPALQIAAEQVVLRLEQENDSVEQLNVSISQLILLQKLQNSLLLMLEGRNDVQMVIQEFTENTMKLDNKLDILLRGDKETKISAVSNAGARFYLEEIEKQLGGLSEKISALLDNATMLQKIYTSVNSSEVMGMELFDVTFKLKTQISNRGKNLEYISMAGYAFGVLSLLSLLTLAYALFHDHRERLRFTEEENERNQDGIMHLTNKMTALAQGDLTISARVSQDITGSISGAFNHTVEALRDLVTKINGTSGRLNDYAQKADKTAAELSRASKDQSNEVLSASTAINRIAENVQQVSAFAVNSSVVANKSLEISRQGANTVRETLSGMHAIREQVQVTAKRIKRLSESSQEVSHISQLMHDIAEQTQVLALNASIQMSSAGDAGKGFGGVAEDVQQLAKKAVATSKKADVLVKTMQMDTQKTVVAMEETITHVVRGTASAEDAGKALSQVEGESVRIAKLMMKIAHVTKEQSELSKRTQKKMISIQDITLQAFERVSETTELINSLTSTANELQVSVYRFKLPNSVMGTKNDQLKTKSSTVKKSNNNEHNAIRPRRIKEKVEEIA